MQRCLVPSGRAAVPGLVAAALLAAPPPTSWAISCVPYCYQGSTNPCSVRETIYVADGLFDCAGMHLRLENGGWLKSVGEDLKVTSDDLWIEGSSSCCGIQVEESTDQSLGALVIEVAGDLALYGKIRANGAGGGGIIDIIVAGDAVLFDNGTDGVEADGTGVEASGGTVRMEAGGSISLYDPIHVEGSGSGPNSGGTIVLRAGMDIQTGADGHISAGGRDMGAGTIRIAAGRDVILNEHLAVDGQSPVAAGGEIEIEAAGAVLVNESIRARGSVNAGSGDAPGGHVRIGSGCGGVSFSATGDIDVAGGLAANGRRGGSVSVSSAGPIYLANGVVVDARGNSSGADAGSVELRSGSALTLDGAAVIATGNAGGAGQGRGGNVELSGCRTELKSGSVVDATGYFGGSVAVYGQNSQATGGTGIQPVRVHIGALLKSAGTDVSRNGTTTLRVDTLRRGICSNDGNLPCWVDTDCTVGCQTGACAAANPDTQGVLSQFDLAVNRSQVPGFGAECSQACQ